MRTSLVNALFELPGIWKSVVKVSYRLGLPLLGNYSSHGLDLQHLAENTRVGHSVILLAQGTVLTGDISCAIKTGARMLQGQMPHRSSRSAEICCRVMSLASRLITSVERGMLPWSWTPNRRFVIILANYTAGI